MTKEDEYRERMKKKLEAYCAGNELPEITESELLEDLKLYCASFYVELEGKAKRIYELCKATGKDELAVRIAQKHGKYLPKDDYSDLAASMAYLLKSKELLEPAKH